MGSRQPLAKESTFGEAMRRGLLRRCPRCGGKGIFDSYFKLKETCPTCGYSFERESGYWVGAMTVNIAVAEAIFFVVFIAVILATMPDVDWVPLLMVALITNAVVPVLFYPFSKTVWMAGDLYFHRYSEEEGAVDLRERTPRA
jgi:uncharacterized protein (DUF983 family)